jgi:2-keto-4-pentenoate hydratase/2-oxohepta-3-ene-1,7-dioic acid hydratase in catechol pathway
LKLANIVLSNQLSAAIFRDGLLFPIHLSLIDLSSDHSYSLGKIISSGLLDRVIDRESDLVSGAKPISVDNAEFAPVVESPEKILMTAINYHGHLKEQKREQPDEPFFFPRYLNSLIAHRNSILKPRISNMVDWEAELAVVIGRKGKYIMGSEHEDYIAGYTIANDISFRDLQLRVDSRGNRFTNWIPGKSLDRSFPLGPFLVTADEFGDPYSRRISLRVNGELRQNELVSDMVFRIDRLMEYISSGITLSPCDVISTGTPGGVAYFTDKRFLREGDMVSASIEGIGTLENTVSEER